nr:TonB-dependent receptor [Opitutaceae bacterium]
RLSLAMIAHDYTNTDIARRNPLYNDPVADANQTQPQLVSSGEEEFRGLAFQAGWKPDDVWTFTGRVVWQDAITVSSPDLPEEEGRPLAGVPRFTATLGASHRVAAGRLRGLNLGASLNHIGDTVQTYERSDRVQVEYPAYQVVGLRASYTWKSGEVTHTASLSVANALDTDLLAKVARVGAERSLTASWRVAW